MITYPGWCPLGNGRDLNGAGFKLKSMPTSLSHRIYTNLKTRFFSQPDGEIFGR